MKQKPKGLKLGKPLFITSLFLLFFAISPSCGQLKQEIIYVIDAHPYRQGHSKALSTKPYLAQESSQISDVSAKIDHTEEGLKKLVVSLNFQKGQQLRELTVTGDITEGSFELARETQDSDNEEEQVFGYGTCFSSECEQVVMDLFYRSETGNLKHLQTMTYTNAVNRPVTYLDEKDVSPEGGRQAEFITQTNIDYVAERLNVSEENRDIFISNRPTTASKDFAKYWKSYLNRLKDRKDLDINPIIPLDSVEIIAQSGAGTLFKLRENPSHTFSRPFNSRVEKNVRIGGDEIKVRGILLNGEPLIDNAVHCVKWADQSSLKKRVRYASALLNAVLLYSGNKLRIPKVIGPCLFEIVVNKSSNEEGGFLRFLSDPSRGHKTHQNGLDVDISYINSEGDFKDVVNGSEVNLSPGDSFRNLRLIKILYDTGMVNRFIMSPYIKAHLVQTARNEKKLEEFKGALEKIFPYAHHEDHIHLEIVCATFGVDSNVGCRETDAKHFKWPISSCNNISCGTEQERIVVIEPEPLPEVVEVIQQDTEEDRPADQTARVQTQKEDDPPEVAQTTEPKTPEPETPEEPTETEPEEEIAKTNTDFSACTPDQKKAIRDEGVHDPEECIRETESEYRKRDFVQSLAVGLELCSWNKFFVSPHICKVRKPLNVSGKKAFFPECTETQARALGSPPPSSVCKHSIRSNYSSLIVDDPDTELCMWSMHVCRAEKAKWYER